MSVQTLYDDVREMHLYAIENVRARNQGETRAWNIDYARGVRDATEDVLTLMVRQNLTLRSHEPPRNSGEGTAVNGPMPLGEKPDANERA